MKLPFLILLFIHAVQIQSQQINLYWLMDIEDNVNRKVAFVSLSDNYWISEHPDSLPFQDLDGLENVDHQFFKLEPEYKERFLTKTNTAESDSLFIYNYATASLLSFPVKQLNAAAYLNLYTSPDDCPCSPYDYMIGFEIEKSLLKGFNQNLDDVLVYVGDKNPFVIKKLDPVTWRKIKAKDFPISKIIQETKNRYPNTVRADAYKFETATHNYFLQDFIKENTDDVKERQLLVIDKRTGEAVAERMFSEGESTSLAPLSFDKPDETGRIRQNQWTGKLFKDKPPVIFGFEWVSFGCPRISIIGSDEDIYINCDNRH